MLSFSINKTHTQILSRKLQDFTNETFIDFDVTVPLIDMYD